jgi:hypothetical protein
VPDFELADVTGILTPETVVGVAAAGIVLGVFFWRMERRVQVHALWMLWITGITFALVMASSRWAYGSVHWEAWLGTAVLWTIYVGASTATIHIWRHALRCHFVRTT